MLPLIPLSSIYLSLFSFSFIASAFIDCYCIYRHTHTFLSKTCSFHILLLECLSFFPCLHPSLLDWYPWFYFVLWFLNDRGIFTLYFSFTCFLYLKCFPQVFMCQTPLHPSSFCSFAVSMKCSLRRLLKMLSNIHWLSIILRNDLQVGPQWSLPSPH